ncbi:calcium-binding protein [Pseudoalteromonas umbrosa]|uniref:calcium-binding protein n=1 Tax=Pseudoalteromonas umbrosa TaxID=3048489 RepID=UPI0024C25D6B|nr:calcium-binding protein [Pseudoalteromonas sp. B95]MDK1286890.1 calcium-binding protein [Pseudoalteromonas sp. B95]
MRKNLSKLTKITASVAFSLGFHASSYACTGLDNSINVTTNTIHNGMMTYLSFTLTNNQHTLHALGGDSFVKMTYGNTCELFDISNYNGVQVNLSNYGNTYNGQSLHTHQLINGGNGDDVIRTGNKVDYVYSGGGNDQLFTLGDTDIVDAGDGIDCAEVGMAGSIPQRPENHELSSCANFSTIINKTQNCTSGGTLFTDYFVNGVWGIQSKINGVSYTFEQYGELVFVNAKLGNASACSTPNTSNIDLIFAKLSSGNDTLNASAVTYNMTVYGLEGKDSITTGSGHDWVFGGSDKDTIRGGAGNDWLMGDSRIETDKRGIVFTLPLGSSATAQDKVYGQDGHDVIFGNGHSDHLEGGNGDDLVFGNAGDKDRLHGNSGDDILVDSGGNKWKKRAKLWGGSGNDIVLCEDGDCELFGGGSADFVASFSQYNHDIGLYGGDGGDTLYNRGDQYPEGSGGGGNDRCHGPCKLIKSSGTGIGGDNIEAAVYYAAGVMTAVYEGAIDMRSFSGNHSDFSKRIADLVDQAALDYWQNNRHQSIYVIEGRK